MHHYRTENPGRKLAGLFRKLTGFFLYFSLILACAAAGIHAAETPPEPTWWVGAAAGVNLNFYGGTTQVLNPAFTTPTAFHKGFGAGLYLAPLIEYRPNPVWGGMLQVGYDDRRGSFDDVTCPCGENATLKAKPSYLSIEPSLRIAPFANGFYVFAGPRFAFDWSFNGEEKTFVYTQDGQPNTKAKFSDMRGTVFSGQVGTGFDVGLTPASAKSALDASPFVSFQPHFGQAVRSSENWSMSTLRVGIAVKFGRRPETGIASNGPDVRFSVRAPKSAYAGQRVRETFPLRNYVFFEEGSTEIPARYVTLTRDQAAGFREEQLQEVRPKSLKGRSQRQMAVYYNILNTVGDRLKRNPKTAITLSGASEKGPEHGKARAESIKRYLVDVFGIDPARIATAGRDKPKSPSEQPGAVKDLDLLRAGDNRVDIESNSPEMLVQVGGDARAMLKPVQIVGAVDPLDTVIVFNAVGADRDLISWTLEVTDEQGAVQHFGPFVTDRATLPASAILGSRPKGDYKVVLIGAAKDGSTVKKETRVHLVRRGDQIQEVVRFSILFDFDQSRSVESYETFLTRTVAPLVPDSGTVVIRGYTDIIGEDVYNANLALQRAQGAQAIIERAVTAKGTRGVAYETTGYGEDPDHAPFDNDLPEQRSYNRAVIIDIVPN